MIEMILATCITMVYNTTYLPWTKEDQENLQFNRGRCVQLYADAPCLKKFIKKGERHYWAICGEVSNEKN